MKTHALLLAATLTALGGCDSWGSRHTDRANDETTMRDSRSTDVATTRPTDNYNATNRNARTRDTYRDTNRDTKPSMQNMSDSPRGADADFLREAAAGGMEEVEMGRLAVRQGASEKTRSFGQHMVDDHTRLNDDVMKVAKNLNLSLPTQLPSEKQAGLSRLAQMSGQDFDREYARMMVTDHEKDVAAFEREARTGEDANVRSAASRALPTLRDHLKMARDMATAAGASAGANTDTSNPTNRSDPAMPNNTNPPMNPR